jgi:hypothetical protein
VLGGLRHPARPADTPAMPRRPVDELQKMSCTMRMRLLLPAVGAVLLLSDQSPRAQSNSGVGCINGGFLAVHNGTTYLEGHTRAGQPCQIGFGMLGYADITALQIVVRPTRGVLGASEKEGTRRYVAYVPRAGFVGHDRFEVFIVTTPPGRPSWTSRIKVEMSVTP